MAYGVGQVVQPKILSPQEHLANALKLRADQLEIDGRAQEQSAKLRKEAEDAQDQAWLNTAAKTYIHEDGSPDMVSIGKAAMQYKPMFGMGLVERISKGQQAEAESVRLDAANKRADFDDDIHKLQRITDPFSFSIWVPRIKDQALLQSIGQQWDETTPQKIQAIIQGGLKETEWLANQEKSAGEYGKNPEPAFLNDVSLSRNDADLKLAFDALKSHVSADVYSRYRQMFPAWSPEVQQLAANQSKTPVQRTAEANTAADNAARDAAAQRQAASDAVNQSLRGREVAVSEARLKQDGAAGGASGAGGAKLTGTAVEKVAAVDQARGMIDDIERLFPNMAGAIGPIDQWSSKAKLKTGKGVTKELADFDTQLTALKNAVIKATTGAAMSEPEAQRIMGQIPDWGNPEQVFKSRLEMTRKNLELLKKRTIELSGGSVETPAAEAATGKQKIGRFEVEVGP